MAVFKCKMCGGSLNVPEGITVCECEYCGITQTLPKTDNEQNLNMMNRANHFRQQCEFDKAMEIYERLLNHSDNDSEIYWSIVLCRYGIEYVDDPMTQKKIPTCHRTQFKSILEDTDYIEAISHADAQQKVLYQNEAQYIDNVQKGILEISNKEDPFDVFICYKESDENGKRTPDSVLAQELYYQLTREGFKVFFSRITLEDKLGTAYEPYIFAALNSSKVMVVVGTKPEYFNAVWVRNEWSRFLMLMQNDRSKILIPAYRDMDPYDLPDALSMFQAQDMSKLGFMQDLLHGIEKIVKADTRQPIISETIVKTVPVNSNVENLIKRGMLSLEDEKWDEANEFFEQVLNENVEEPRAYLGKLMAELKMSSEDNLSDLGEDFSDRSNYKKAFRFGDEAFKKRIQNYNFLSMYNGACLKMSTAKNEDDYRKVKELFLLLGDFSDSVEKVNECEEKIKEYVYQKICTNAKIADSEEDWLKIAKGFEKLNGYKDSNERQETCKEKAADAHNYYLIYKSALSICQKNEDIQKSSLFRRYDNIMAELESAITKYESIRGYRDSEEKIEWCRRKIEEIKEIKIADENRKKELERQEKRRDKNKKIAMFIGGICIVVIVFVIIFNVVIVPKVIIPYNKYENAVELYNNEKYDEAITALEELGEYKDSKDIIFEIYEVKYNQAKKLIEDGQYNKAIDLFREIEDYKDSKNKINDILKTIYKTMCTVSAGTYYTVGIKLNHTVAAIGKNRQGQCNVQGIQDWNDIIAVSAGYGHTVGLKSDGTVTAVGDNSSGQCNVEDWTNIIAISAGSAHTVGLKSDGTVVAAGINNYNRCNVEDWTDIVAISAGNNYTVGLKSDGTVVAVGKNNSNQCDVEDWTNIVEISAGGSYTVGLKSDGTVIAVGNNTYGQCNVNEWHDIIAISAGSCHTVGLKKDGTVVAVGSVADGKCSVGSWKDIIAISAGDVNTVGLKKDGTVLVVGNNDYQQCNVGSWSKMLVE